MHDFLEAYPPMSEFSIARLLLIVVPSISSLSSTLMLNMLSCVKYGGTDATVCIKLPEGYNDGTHRVCKLITSWYRLNNHYACGINVYLIFPQGLDFTTPYIIMHSSWEPMTRSTPYNASCRCITSSWPPLWRKRSTCASPHSKRSSISPLLIIIIHCF